MSGRGSKWTGQEPGSTSSMLGTYYGGHGSGTLFLDPDPEHTITKTDASGATVANQGAVL